MLQSEIWYGFDSRRRSLRLEQGGKLSCTWVLPIVRLQLFKFYFGQYHEANMLQRWHSSLDIHHYVNELGHTSRKGIWTPNLKPQTLTCTYYDVVHVCLILSKVHIHMSSRIRTNKMFISYTNFETITLRPLDLLRFCWNDEYFVLTTSRWKIGNGPKENKGFIISHIYEPSKFVWIYGRHPAFSGIQPIFKIHLDTISGLLQHLWTFFSIYFDY